MPGVLLEISNLKSVVEKSLDTLKQLTHIVSFNMWHRQRRSLKAIRNDSCTHVRHNEKAMKFGVELLVKNCDEPFC